MIYSVVFKVTHACNLACQYCYAGVRHSRIATSDTLAATIRSAVQLDADTVTLIWHGGEPLLAGLDFFAVAVALQSAVAAWSGKRFVNALQTNGTLVTPEFARFFKEQQFAVGVSLDGPAPWHDAQRTSAHGRGSYQAALAGFHTLVEAGVQPGLVCVLDPVSPPEPGMLVDWLGEVGARSISLNPLFTRRTAPYGDYPHFLTALRAEVRKRSAPVCVRELVLAGTTFEQRQHAGLLDACHPGWPCYETISAVDEQGDIFFGCDRFMDSRADGVAEIYRLASVHDGGFRKALASPKFARFAAEADKQKQFCQSACNLAPTCDGGCVADWLLSPAEDATRRPEVVYCRGMHALSAARRPPAEA